MRNVLTALDVGTSKVCALVAESLPEGGGATVLGYGVAPCTGLRKGVVVNIEATVEAIRAAVTEAEKTAGVRVGRGGGRRSRARTSADSTATESSRCAAAKSARATSIA